MHAVTRVEVVEAVKTAFTITAQPTVPRDLVEAATASGARPAVVTVLEGLDDDLQFRKLRELWEYFPHMPVNTVDAESGPAPVGVRRRPGAGRVEATA